MDQRTEALLAQLQNEIDMLKGHVESLTHELNLKTDKNDIINQINISPENIRISADKISINGRTNIAENSISSSHIKSVSGDKISVRSLSEISTTMGAII